MSWFRWLFGVAPPPAPAPELEVDVDANDHTQCDPDYCADAGVLHEAEPPEAEPPEAEPEKTDPEEPKPAAGMAVPGQAGYETQRAMLAAMRNQDERVTVAPSAGIEQKPGERYGSAGSVGGSCVVAHGFSIGEFEQYIAGTPLFPRDLFQPPQGVELNGIERVLYKHYMRTMPEEERQKLYASADGMQIPSQPGLVAVDLGGMEAVRLMAYRLTQQALAKLKEGPPDDPVSDQPG